MNAGSIMLPCPFCGGPGVLCEGHHNHWYAACSRCGVCRSTFANGGVEQDKARAIRSWNARAAIEATRPPIGTDEVVERPLSFAWTATEGYKHYPPYVNINGNRMAVRGEEWFDGKHYQAGSRVAVELPPEAMNELLAAISALPAIDQDGGEA